MSGEMSSLKDKESLPIADHKPSDFQKTESVESQISELEKLLNSCISEKNSLSKIMEEKDNVIQQQINKLKDMKTDFEITKQKIETELEQKQKEYKESEEDRCRLNIDLDDLKHKYLFLEMKMKEKEDEAIGSCQMIRQLEGDVKKYFTIEKDLTNQMKACEEELKKAGEDIESSKSVISELQEEVSRLLSESEEHTKDEFNLRNHISTTLEDNINDLNKAIISQTKHEEEHCKEKQSLKTVINEFKSLFVKLNEDLVVRNEVYDVLRKVLTKRNETIKELEDNFKTFQFELHSVKEKHLKDNLSKETNIGELQKKIESCINELSAVKVEREYFSLELTNLKEKYDLEVKKNQDLYSKIVGYTSKLNIFAKDLTEKDNKIYSLNKEIEELRKQKFEIEESKEVIENKVRDLKEELSSVENEKKAILNYVNVQQGKIDYYVKVVETWVERYNNLYDAKYQVFINEEKMKSRYDHLNTNVSVLKEILNIFIHNHARLHEKYDEKGELVEEFSFKLQEQQSKSSEEIKKLKEEYEEENSKLMEDINNLISEFGNLKDEKEILFKKLKNIEMDHSSCEDKIKNLETLISDMKDREISINRKLAELREREETLNLDINDKEVYTADLNNQISCLKKLVSTYEVEEGILKTKLETKEAEIAKLKLHINGLTKEAKINEEKIEEELKLKVKKIQDLDLTIATLNSHYMQVSKEKELLIFEIKRNKILESDLKSLEAKFQLLKEERELILKNENILQLKNTISICEDKIHSLKTERDYENKIMQDKLKELVETKSSIKILQHEKLENKMKEKAMIEHLVLQNDMIVNMEKNLAEFDCKLSEAESEIVLLKDTVQKKEEAVENISKDYNCLKLDFDILLKKNELMISESKAKNNEFQLVWDKLNEAQKEISILTLNISEQERTIQSLYSTLHHQNSDINERNKEIDIFKKEIKKYTQQLSEERNTKQNEIQKLNSDKDVQDKELETCISEDEYKERVEQINKSSYEKKVHTLKAVMPEEILHDAEPKKES